MDDPGIVLSEFYFDLHNYTVNPLYTDVSENYKPWRWYRTRSQHGRTLLQLSFNYNVLSMSILTIGVDHHKVELVDSPFGCFGNISAEARVLLIRNLILDSFRQVQKSKSQIEYESHIERTVFVCNEIVRDSHGYAEFLNRCCHQEADGSVECTDQVEDQWIGLLYICITLVKVFVFFFSPVLIPTKMYSASYVASEYVVNLAKAIKMKIFITKCTETSVRFKRRLTPEDFSDWRRFRENLDTFPMDEIIPVKVEELRIKVKGKRVIPDNDPPTGVFRTIFDNLIRCKIKRLDPFTECCDRSVYASLEPRIKNKCTWHMCVQSFVKVLMLFLLPLPYYIRIVIYYKFEEEEVYQRKFIADKLNLATGYDFYRSNVIQYLSPVHGVFIATYSFYFLAGLVIGFTEESVREKLKTIARSSLQDMDNVSRTSVLQVLLRIGLWPFKNYGLLAIILVPLYAMIAGPICSFLFALYCVPTVYLSYRLLYHSRKQTGVPKEAEEYTRPMSKRREKVVKIKKKFQKIDRDIHRQYSSFEQEDSYFPYTWGYTKLHAIRRFIIQSLVGIFCLACLYAMVLLFVEALGLLVEVLAFTMMGIIINAGSTLRYVSMALLVLVYMHDCYSNVYESYLTFNKTVCEDVMDRVEDLKQVASLPSSMQENAAFQVKPVEAVDVIPTTMSFKKKDPQWKIGHLLLFLDSFDTPRIPLRLFQQICEVRVHGAPGPVYINLLRATGKFLIIVVFLFFVMIVVMAFGNVHQISSTNQTLATLAGGFVPMLLKNVLPRRSVKLNLKTLSFKGQIDEIICDFKQNWPLCDFICEKDTGDEDGTDSKSEADDDTKVHGSEDSDDKNDEGNEKGKGNEKDKDKDKDKEKTDRKEAGTLHEGGETTKCRENDGTEWHQGEKWRTFSSE